ncbi:MAG TPA: cupin domain-containing protein [Candidatus Paceibacterota bacterium]
MEKPIINISELDYQGFPGGRPEHVKEKYDGSVMGQVATRIGAKKPGYNITKIPAGKRAFPFHSHRVNEEMFFVVEGNGEVRIGDKTYAIKKGDFIACPPGGPDTAHQIINTSKAELLYVGVSTKEAPEIADYPDSKKFGVMSSDGFRFLGKADQSLGYWDGE